MSNNFDEKINIANICENLYKECLREIPQFENGELIWILNGSTLCNFLYNVVKIDGINVSEEFRNSCYEFIRQPKGDIDITYKAGRNYKFDFNNKYIIDFQRISEEQRTYNFVDSNSELSEDDFEELCTMETKSGLVFIAKKPQYLFLYKFKEFLAIFSEEILNNDLNAISNKKKNILSDVVNLYNIGLTYCKEDELLKLFSKLPIISSYLKGIYEEDSNKFNELIDASLKIIRNLSNSKKKKVK